MRNIVLFITLFASLILKASSVTSEGAWCWFADPRALHHETVDGRINKTYIGYIDTHGNIKAMQYDFNRHNQTEVLVRSYFQPDDHDNPTFLILPDQRIMVFYSRHTDEPCFYYRVSLLPGDITMLGEEHVIATDHNTTYPSPFILSDDPDHFYLCWRGINWHPTIARLTLPDAAGNVSIDKGPYQIVQSTGARPYAKYTSDGRNRILLTYTTGHPDNESPNYLYYNYIDINDMNLYDIRGRKLAQVDQAPLHVDKTGEFVDANSDMLVDATKYRDWVWQIVADAQGNPVIAMTRISDDKKSHNYYVAKWTGNRWQKSHIAHGGGHFHQSPRIEHCYSAGMALDTSDPNNVYCSVPVDGVNGKVYEIVKYRIDGEGEIVNSTQITANSDKNNVRPYFIGGTSDTQLKLAWMKGDYHDWIVSAEYPSGYCTGIECDFPGFTYDRHGRHAATGVEPNEVPQKFDGEDFVVTKHVDLNALDGSEILNLGKLTYCYDHTSMRPEIRYGKNVYRSSNLLATADSWKQQQRSTNGKWYDAVPLESFDLKIVYADGVVTTYINSILDQKMRIEPSKEKKSVFVVDKPDYKLSPLTGMTRKHWIEAAEYLLSGAFGYIKTLDDAMYFPKQLDKTYPRGDHDIKVAKLEGLARTFFLAAPLLKENPDLTLNGIKVADYYRYQLLGLVTEGNPNYERPFTNSPTQTLLELSSLCISLEITKDVIWDSFTQAQQDALAALLKAYGEGPTIGSNWKFFNVFSLSFLKGHGYAVNEDYLKQNIEDLLNMYRGEGWYNDAPAYDYYSMWAFQTYGPLWAHLFGKQQYPAYAEQFTKNQADLIDNYPYMFSRDGRMNMYGRSIPYRFACIAPLGMIEFGGHDDVNYGWLRQISSATLLQFLQNPDFLEDGIPTLGYYGAFAPATQIYSCRGSVFWMGKAFFNLLLPEDSAYWSATENRGPWDTTLKKGDVYNKFQPATNLMITNYPNIGGSEIRSWCKERVASDWQKFRSSENYNKLSYHTEFPWMADGANGEISMNYGTINAAGKWEVLRLYDFKDFDGSFYRRDAVLETDPGTRYQLAEMPLPDGVLHVAKVTVSKPTKVRLGSYSLPEVNSRLKAYDKGDAYMISNGQYRLAVKPLKGWSDTFAVYPEGLHPVSDRCSLIINEADVADSEILVTLHLWQKGDKDIDSKLLGQIRSVDISADKMSATITFADSSVKTVLFD